MKLSTVPLKGSNWCAPINSQACEHILPVKGACPLAGTLAILFYHVERKPPASQAKAKKPQYQSQRYQEELVIVAGVYSPMKSMPLRNYFAAAEARRLPFCVGLDIHSCGLRHIQLD